MNTVFQPTANCQFTICLTQGVHPKRMSIPLSNDPQAILFALSAFRRHPLCR